MSGKRHGRPVVGSMGGRERAIIAATLALFAVPILADVCLSGTRGPFAYLAADAFFYLTVARNTVDFGVVSFDQTHLTNGFHPLWQFIETLLYACARLLGLSEVVVLYVVVVLCALLTGVAVVYLGRCFHRIRELSASFLLMPVGALALFYVPLWLIVGHDAIAQAIEGYRPLPTTLWLYVNGMETGLLLCAYAATFHHFVARGAGRSRGEAVVLGLLLALLTLARLDHGVFAVAMLGSLFLAARSHRSSELFRQGVVAAIAFTLPLLVYVILNKALADSFIPVSGNAKRVFPSGNFTETLGYLLGVLEGDLELSRGYRLISMVVPTAVAGVYVCRALWPSSVRDRLWILVTFDGRFRWFMAVSGFGVLGLGVYNFLFVPLFGQGTWYYPVSTVFVTLLAIRACHRVGVRAIRGRKRLALGLSCLWGVACLVIFLTLHRDEAYHRRLAHFFHHEAARVRTHYAESSPRLTSNDDGIIAFSVGFPALNSRGLMVDDEARDALENERFLDLAYRRGFGRLTTLHYADFTGMPEEEVIRQMRSWFARDLALDDYHYTMDYRSRDGSFAIVRFEPGGERMR